MSAYMSRVTEPRVVETVERQLLQVPMQTLLGSMTSGLAALLRDDKLEDLRLLYWLYRRVPGGLDSVLT